MWESQDKHNYLVLQGQGIGQIHNDGFALQIRKYAADPQYRSYLEIGTWNGLGSTKAFAEGFVGRDPRAGYIFYSLECNQQKSIDAARLYRSNPNMHVLNEVIWNRLPPDFYSVFPEARDNPQFRHWNAVDIGNMQRCKLFLERPELPIVFDVLLLDGGEYTTYYEFLALKDRCKVLMLDDVNTSKCARIMADIAGDPSWTIVVRGETRNGYLIAERA